MGDYPLHEKLASKQVEHKTVVSFLEFLMDHETYRIRIETLLPEDPEVPFEREEDRWHWMPGRSCFADLIAGFFEIDQGEFEKEKQRMLDELRAGGKKK